MSLSMNSKFSNGDSSSHECLCNSAQPNFGFDRTPLRFIVKSILLALGAIVASNIFLFYTLIVVPPFSFYSSFTSSSALPRDHLKKKKVILVVGADQEIGFRVMEQYVHEFEVTIIASSDSIDEVITNGDKLSFAPAPIQCAIVDFGGAQEALINKIKRLDVAYGPITHFYDVTAASISYGSASEQLNAKKVRGSVAATQAVFDLMLPRKHGKIFITSVSSHFHLPTITFYDISSKHFEVVATEQANFLDPAGARQKRLEESAIPETKREAAKLMATKMKELDETDWTGSSPPMQSLMMFVPKAFHSIFEEMFHMEKTKQSMKIGDE